MALNAVLLVEDDADAQEIMQIVFKTALGLRTTIVKDGHDALRMARETRPPLVVLDLTLPENDGFAVARCLKSDPATSGIPLLALSSLWQAGEAAESAGCDDYLEKPFTLSTLLAKVRRHVKMPLPKIRRKRQPKLTITPLQAS